MLKYIYILILFGIVISCSKEIKEPEPQDVYLPTIEDSLIKAYNINTSNFKPLSLGGNSANNIFAFLGITNSKLRLLSFNSNTGKSIVDYNFGYNPETETINENSPKGIIVRDAFIFDNYTYYSVMFFKNHQSNINNTLLKNQILCFSGNTLVAQKEYQMDWYMYFQKINDNHFVVKKNNRTFDLYKIPLDSISGGYNNLNDIKL